MYPVLTSTTISGLKLINSLIPTLVFLSSSYTICLSSWYPGNKTKKPMVQETRRLLRLAFWIPVTFLNLLSLTEKRSFTRWNLVGIVSCPDAAFGCLWKAPLGRPVMFLAPCPRYSMGSSYDGLSCLLLQLSELEGDYKHMHYAKFNITFLIRSSLPGLGLWFESVVWMPSQACFILCSHGSQEYSGP